MTKWTIEQLERWIDHHAVDRNGRRIGTIADVYVDDATGQPEWIAVMTGLFGSRISFVPLRGANERDGELELAYEKSIVKDSPTVEADGQLTEDEEERLYRHYGLPYGAAIMDVSDYAPAASIADDVDDVAKLQSAGSASTTADVSPEVARLRLRRRDQAAVESIDLRSDDLDPSTASSTDKHHSKP